MKIKSIGYLLLKSLVKIPYSLFYRKIKVLGKENIPQDKPIIFAPNHQNALMDPLVMIYSTTKQIVFLARGDIFKGKVLVKILTFLKILPVYRQHDGKAALKKNDEVFAKSVDYLSRFGSFCLFPEARHNPHRNLRPLKKGIPRIAFQTLEAKDYDIDIQIVPTGIYYEDKDNSHSYLQIKYGKPIAVKDYIDQIKENEQKAMLQLSQDMTPCIEPLILNIPEKEDYDLIEKLRSVFTDYKLKKTKEGVSDIRRFEYDQKLIATIDGREVPESIKGKIERLHSKMSKQNWPVKFLHKEKSWFSVILLGLLSLIFSPISLLGYLINRPPFFLQKYICKHIIKDPQFISSVKFVVGAILMPIYFLILSLISLFFLEAWQSLVLLFVLPMVSYASYYSVKKLNSLFNRIKYKASADKHELSNLYLDANKEIENWLNI